MEWFIIGATFDMIGKVSLGVMILLVHKHILKEHKIDRDVLKQMRKEQVLDYSELFLF